MQDGEHAEHDAGDAEEGQQGEQIAHRSLWRGGRADVRHALIESPFASPGKRTGDYGDPNRSMASAAAASSAATWPGDSVEPPARSVSPTGDVCEAIA